MGDYYKIKKILLILIIICTILRIINNSKVFASEAVEVTPTYNDGSYTVQNDNNYELIRQQQLDLQTQFITMIYNNYNAGDSTTKSNIRVFCRDIFNNMASRVSNRNSSRWVVFLRTNYSGDTSATFSYLIVTASGLNTIIYPDLILNNGYKLSNVPHYTISRNNIQKEVVVNNLSGSTTNWTSGDVNIPVACVGIYTEEWINLFFYLGILNNTTDYNSVLNDIRDYNENSYYELQNQTYLQNQTNTTITNSYNYIKDENIDEITSLGFSSPDVEEKIDLNDVFDQFEALLTDENYHPKQFSFWLPNGDENVFSISPTILEDNLTRVGGGNIIQIIHAIWFISLYGWYIFAYFGILGKLLSGDWFHLVRSSSPVTRLVKFSVGSITGNVRF